MNIQSGPPLLGRMALTTALFIMGIGLVCGESAAKTSLESFPDEQECCIYHGLSEELFTECCNRVGFCPDCPPISRGLDRGPVDFNYWLDHHGGICTEGSEWLTTPCRQCHCRNGVVTCQPIRPVCLPPPQPYCRELPGDCCPTWDCTLTNGCVDDARVHHEEGTFWSDSRDSCTIYFCTASGIVTLDAPCQPLPPRPYPRCTIITVGCCQQWSCTSECVEKFGNQRVEGEQWVDPSDPCYTLTCTPTGIQQSLIPCPTLPPQPHYACRVEHIGCCRKWTCDGCVDDAGVRHDEGASWSDSRDPCTIYFCTASGIVTRGVPCQPLPPRPHSRCTIVLVNCCEEWNCRGCVDYAGVHHDIDDTWTDETDECTSHTCTENGIISFKVFCPPPPPPPSRNCNLVTVHCCQEWDCFKPTGCVDYARVHHDEETSWSDSRDPCTIYFCTASGIVTLDAPCQTLPPRPHPRCTIVIVNCCEEWNCMSWDYQSSN